jgi:hypothetical protein
MTGRAAKIHRVLAGHQSVVALVIASCEGDVTSCKHMVHAGDAKVRFDVQTALPIMRAENLCRQFARLQTACPYDGPGGDAFAVC